MYTAAERVTIAARKYEVRTVKIYDEVLFCQRGRHACTQNDDVNTKTYIVCDEQSSMVQGGQRPLPVKGRKQTGQARLHARLRPLP